MFQVFSRISWHFLALTTGFPGISVPPIFPEAGPLFPGSEGPGLCLGLQHQVIRAGLGEAEGLGGEEGGEGQGEEGEESPPSPGSQGQNSFIDMLTR